MATDAPELEPREAMECDVVVVGAGPAGLATAIRLRQLAAGTGRELSVIVLEKGSEVGAHIVSGAVIDPIGLDRLIPAFDPGYRTRLGQFERAMQHRNRLLAESVRDDARFAGLERIMAETGVAIAG